MNRRLTIIIAILILSIIGVGIWQSQMDFSVIADTLRSHPYLGAAFYIGLLIVSVVFLPLSSLPLLPLAASVYGVWMTGFLSIVGWWIGSLIAFQIARFGRKYLVKIASLDAIDRVEKKIPKDVGFVSIVILRMIFPVDVTSFALGLLKNLSFTLYATASLIGIIPFAFVWSYAGGELAEGKFLISAGVFVLMTILVFVIRRVWNMQSH